jgi:hypothetical protein
VTIVTNAPGASPTVAVSGTGVAVVPTAPTIGTAVRGNGQATVNWTAPVSDGGSPVTGYQVRVLSGGVQQGALLPAPAGATSLLVTGLTNGTAYRFQVQALNAVGASAFSAQSAPVTPATTPGAPVITAVAQGAAGGARTASVTWTPPVSNGGSAVTAYTVSAFRVATDGTVAATAEQSVVLGAGARTRNFTFTSPAGTSYVFEVFASNAVGNGPAARSGTVVPR